MNKFFETKVDYFWELEYPFAEYFLKDIFKETFKRKYLIKDSGIVNLIYLDNKVYEVKFTQGKAMLPSGSYVSTDKWKTLIMEMIWKNLYENGITELTTDRGKFITFRYEGYIIKLEIIKKMREPE